MATTQIIRGIGIPKICRQGGGDKYKIAELKVDDAIRMQPDPTLKADERLDRLYHRLWNAATRHRKQHGGNFVARTDRENNCVYLIRVA